MFQKQIPEELEFTDGDGEVTGSLSGYERLNHRKHNKGLAFTLEERQLLGIHGLLAPVIRTMDEQVKISLLQLERLSNDLDKFIFLSSLAEHNEHLFYKLLTTHISKCLPYVYTPTVGKVCQNYSLIYTRPRGMYITLFDRGHIYDVMKNWPENDVRAICVTDGGRILGLGDLGANGMGIPVGKMALYTALGGIKPHHCLPITLDVGCDTDAVRNDPLYIGLRRKRPSIEVYDEFVDEFMEAVIERFGRNCLVHFEDFANDNAFRLLKKYRNDYCTFNDDIQGTAAIGVAGIYGAVRSLGTSLREQKFLFLGAGEAAIGIASLLLKAMQEGSLPKHEARKRIWLFDTKGLIVHKRPSGGLTPQKRRFAQRHEPVTDFLKAIEVVKPTILIGASGRQGAFTEDVLMLMAKLNARPVIFALSNPTSNSECTANEAYIYTRGKCIFAAGSPFPPVKFMGRYHCTSQVNNAYIFPGISLAITTCGIKHVTDDVFLVAVQSIAQLCTEEDIAKGLIFPPLEKLSCCALKIAVQVSLYAYIHNLATLLPKPTNLQEFIINQMYNPNYESPIPRSYIEYKEQHKSSR